MEKIIGIFVLIAVIIMGLTGAFNPPEKVDYSGYYIDKPYNVKNITKNKQHYQFLIEIEKGKFITINKQYDDVTFIVDETLKNEFVIFHRTNHNINIDDDFKSKSFSNIFSYWIFNAHIHVNKLGE